MKLVVSISIVEIVNSKNRPNQIPACIYKLPEERTNY